MLRSALHGTPGSAGAFGGRNPTHGQSVPLCQPQSPSPGLLRRQVPALPAGGQPHRTDVRHRGPSRHMPKSGACGPGCKAGRPPARAGVSDRRQCDLMPATESLNRPSAPTVPEDGTGRGLGSRWPGWECGPQCSLQPQTSATASNGQKWTTRKPPISALLSSSILVPIPLPQLLSWYGPAALADPRYELSGHWYIG